MIRRAKPDLVTVILFAELPALTPGCGPGAAAAVILPDALHVGSRAVTVAVLQVMAGRSLA
jgi:hypothetical protein